MLEHGAEIAEVVQLEVAVVAELEDEREHPGLRVVQLEDLREQQGAERRDRRAQLGAAGAGQAEELDRAGSRRPLPAGLRGALADPVVLLSGGPETREVALQVGEKHRHAGGGELLGHQLERLRLAGAGGARDESMAVHHGERHLHQRLRSAFGAGEGSTEGQRWPRARERRSTRLQQLRLHVALLRTTSHHATYWAPLTRRHARRKSALRTRAA